MKKMTHLEIRKMWLNYFTEHGHKIVESASLIPVNDDSLLWVNAGVTPLKKYFDGSEIPDSKRLTNIQKCIRTNDIENVGITKRHQTFFEMMGNFSIGDYFKEEAIELAWNLLTRENYFAIPKEKLYVTVYTKDKEAYNKWIEVGMMPEHIIKLDGNFWEIGNGPCGPDSEIFYDRGEKYDKKGEALELFKMDEEQERFIEIWNNVFSQFNSEEGKQREEYKELPHKNIDTGAGLERWCLIFQDVDSNFETDLFMPTIKHIEEITNITYMGQKDFKIIADHIRTITFALSDGANFSNTGRGYVLRRLLRRSVRAGKKLGLNEAFLYKLVSTVIEIMEEAYPYLREKQAVVETKILEEEKLFLSTLNEGERVLKDMLKNVHDGILSGNDAFKLYDTYGFPFELTLEYLNELGYTTNKEEFDKYMLSQKELARRANRTKASMATEKQILLDFHDKSEFVYGIYRLKTKVIAIFSKDSLLNSLNKEGGYIALDRTCLYATQGGQINDTGMIIGTNFKARVIDVFKGPNGQNIHKIKLLDGTLKVGEECEVIVDRERRNQIEKNHSSVHLLHYALRYVVNENIRQAGSYVDNEKLRFDFTYSGKLTDEDIIKVEEKVNSLINDNLLVSTEIMPIDKAKQLGAMALFSEKYGEVVRVVKMGKSIELCGGTHTKNTKDIKQFAIFSYESKGSDTYRIEAVTDNRIDVTLFEVIKPYNDEMIKLLIKAKEILDDANKLGVVLDFDVNIDNSKPISYKDIVFNQNELLYIQNEVKSLEKKYLDIREKKTLNNLDLYKKNIKEINDKNYLVMKTNNMDVSLLKVIADNLINNKLVDIVFFANQKLDRSVNYICRSITLDASYLVKNASIASNGNGGGSKTFAQGGGKDCKGLNVILTDIEKEIRDEL
ncbi:MAG: alanine--tRNA ligase [Bacilli bacterium]|nr:alanine--tRNA ligase [Bacilli bacterium]